MGDAQGRGGLLDRVASTIKELDLVREGERVLAAVSAGLDSMVMLDVLHRLSADLDFSLAVASFDHRLRGDQGQRECDLVGKYCRTISVPFVSGGDNVAALARRQKIGLQDAARRARYAFLWNAFRAGGCHRLATGHHRDDQAETVLIRLLSGSGLTGLAGIAPVSCGGKLIRPLLSVPRTDLESYAEKRRLPFAEDPTNVTDKYLRGKVRHRLIPGIAAERDPRIVDRLVSLSREAASLNQALEERLRALSGGVVRTGAGNSLVLDCQALELEPAFVARHLLRQQLFKFTGGRVILSGRPLAALQRLALQGRSGQCLDLPGQLDARREYDLLTLSGKNPRSGLGQDQAPETELPREGTCRLALSGTRWEITLRLLRQGKDPLSLDELAGNPFRQLFDADRLGFPLFAGAWRPGERMRPFGLGGTKKLKKILGEKRVPLDRRRQIPVLRDSGGEVLWLCGLARSEKAPLGPDTGNLLEISARPLDSFSS